MLVLHQETFLDGDSRSEGESELKLFAVGNRFERGRVEQTDERRRFRPVLAVGSRREEGG